MEMVDLGAQKKLPGVLMRPALPVGGIVQVSTKRIKKKNPKNS